MDGRLQALLIPATPSYQYRFWTIQISALASNFDTKNAVVGSYKPALDEICRFFFTAFVFRRSVRVSGQNLLCCRANYIGCRFFARSNCDRYCVNILHSLDCIQTPDDRTISVLVISKGENCSKKNLYRKGTLMGVLRHLYSLACIACLTHSRNFLVLSASLHRLKTASWLTKCLASIVTTSSRFAWRCWEAIWHKLSQ